MEGIVLRPDLRETLERDAEQEQRSLDDLVNEAVERYLRDRQRARPDNEIAAYQTMHAELLAKYPDEWVALHNQALVDHDRDRPALYTKGSRSLRPDAGADTSGNRASY